MCAKSTRILLLMISLFAFGAASGFAQGVFGVASSAAIAADIGFAEPAGTISLTVISGTTVAAPLMITYSAPITNNAASEISISGTGVLSGIAASPILDRANNAITINIPAGGTVGNQVLISGVRVAISGLELTQVQATITSPAGTGNLIALHTNPVVIGTITEPFSLDQSGVAPLSYAAGTAINDSTSFVLAENFSNAFTGTIGIGGQTLPTRIRITPFPALPDGVKIAFASPATAQTGAMLTTLSGSPETVPRTDGSSDVIFQFIPGPSSSAMVESFHFEVTMTQPPASGSGIIQFQAALVPIGLATPNQQYPSTDIPRYSERLVPDETELTTGSTELVFPFRNRDEDTYTGLAVTNPQNFKVKATLTAYDAAGNVIAGDNVKNPVDIVVPRNGQYARVASEIFGDGFDVASSGTIRLIAAASGLKGFYLIGDNSGPKLDGGTAEVDSSRFWYMPLVFRQGSDAFNLLEIYNAGELETTVDLQLLDADGALVATDTETVPAGGSLLRDIGKVPGVNLDSFQGGYVKARSDFPIVFRNNFGNALDSNALSAQLPLSAVSFYVPHFATGGQYVTELTLVNTNARRSSEITLTLLDDSGTPISTAGNPATVSINSGAQLTRTIGSLFPNLGPNLVTGSIQIDVKPSYIGPFLMGPGLVGAVRFAAADGSASATLPLILSPTSDCVYSHIAQGPGYYTGLAVQNTNKEATGFTVDVYTKDGVLVGSFPSVLQPGARFAKLISELVPASAGQTSGYFRIRSDAPLANFALFGTTDVRSLSAIAPQVLR